jgi:hypothetical protein
MAEPVDSEETRRVREAMPFAGVVGIQAIAASVEEVRARLEWDATRCTAGGELPAGRAPGSR